jgi:tRNA (guanine26-N2/guanine27-N2)-dimethyltransferase
MMENESNFPPYFYTLGEIGKRGKMDIPPKMSLIQALQSQGYRATETHIHSQAIKSDADLTTCIAIAKTAFSSLK